MSTWHHGGVDIGGSTIVVTGASHGIGRATALTLADHGAAVVAVGRDREALDSVAVATGGTSVVVDVADPAHAPHVVDRALAEYGRVDAVVANAGIGHTGAFADMPVGRMERLLAVNLHAPMLLARAAMPAMIEQGSGALVFVTSIAGVVPVPQEAAYCVSKTALESFADSVRGELRGTGVSVSTVRPGVVRTAFLDRRAHPYDRRFPRPLAPERVAAAVVDVLVTGAEQRTEPRWLDVAARLRASSPWLYRSLARRFG
jgi:short-subunit dehydrogenase